MGKWPLSFQKMVLGSSLIFGSIQFVAASDQYDESRVEEIYIARSVRESRIQPTEFCNETRTGFAISFIEDQYTLRSTATRGSDGLMVNTNVQTIGKLHACFGKAADFDHYNFYAEGALGEITLKIHGECLAGENAFPEPGLTTFRCLLDIGGLPKGYVGGLMTSNTLNSYGGGLNSNPAGYTQSSIVTIRLWKTRSDH